MNLETAVTFTHGHFNQVVFAVYRVLIAALEEYEDSGTAQKEDVKEMLKSFCNLV